MYVILTMPLVRVTKEQDASSIDEIILEEGAIVNGEQLENFLLFFLPNGESRPELASIRGNLLSVDKEYRLPGKLVNHCQDFYCYQYRVGFDHIPSIFWKGLIGIEDYRFLDHFGIDFKSILRAIVTDLKELRLAQGGSTLTQQLVKNLFLSNKKTVGRKLREIIYSIYIEFRFSKEEILEAYFNEVYWGALEGIQIKGIHAAALYYFNTPLDHITPYQAAILISLLKGPTYYHPINHLDRLKDRTNTVLKKLVDLNLFSYKVSNVWNESQWKTWHQALISRSEKKLKRAIWQTTRTEKQYFTTYELYSFIVSVNNTLKSIEQRIGDKDIAVKAVIGMPFTNKEEFSFYSKVERQTLRAIHEEYHQVGSALKPIIYSIFMAHGKSLFDTVSTEELSLNLKSGIWTPREAHEIEEKEITLLEALLKSYNRPLIRVAHELGFDSIEQDLLVFVPKIKSPLAEFPAQLLGAVELSPYELYQSYIKFVQKECRVLEEREPENILLLMSDPKETTVKMVVGDHIGDMRFFGKTGTSNDGLDNWYVFFDGRLLGVIWVGLEGKRSNEKLNLYGSVTAFKIFQDFLRDRGKRFNELNCDAGLAKDEQE